MRLWACRLLIGAVLCVNISCAAVFLANPRAYVPGFELQGTPGQAAVQGMGILFLMWSIPYAVAFSHPIRRRISLYEAAAMQAIGLVGETVLLAGLPVENSVLRASITRFLVFDAAGLAALAAAAWLVWRSKD